MTSMPPTQQRRAVPASLKSILMLLTLSLSTVSAFSPFTTTIRRGILDRAIQRRRSDNAIPLQMADFFADQSQQNEDEEQELDLSQMMMMNPLFKNNTAALSLPLIPDDNHDDAATALLSSNSNSYWTPRLLLGLAACIYGTNFPLGSLLDHAMPAAAVCTLRFGLAALALAPFALQLPKAQWRGAVTAGCFTALGYITQAMAFTYNVPPATVSFLGATLVVWCPLLEYVLDGKPSSWRDRPQTYVAAALCLAGVGILELVGSGSSEVATATMATESWVGDVLAIVQAIGFGTGVFLSERLMHDNNNQQDTTLSQANERQEQQSSPNNALPITAVLVATTAVVSSAWWLVTEGAAALATMSADSTTLSVWCNDLMQDYTTTTLSAATGLPLGLLLVVALLWTGIVSTSLNFGLEIWSLGRVPSGEASVWLASEPLWAALFGAMLLGEQFAWNDYMGGALIVAACIFNSVLSPEDIHGGVEKLSSTLGLSGRCQGTNDNLDDESKCNSAEQQEDNSDRDIL